MKKLLNILLVFIFFFSTPIFAQEGGVIFYSARISGIPAGQPNPFPLFNHIPALCRIQFRYRDDDHHVLHMQGLPSDSFDFYNFRFHDNDINLFSYYGVFEWWDLDNHLYVNPQQFVSDEVSCSGRCNIPIPPLAPDREFGLAGFDFEFEDGDHHLLEMSIVPRPRLGRIEVNFRDNSTPPYIARVAYVTFERGNWRRAQSLSRRAENTSVLRRAHRGMKVLQGFRARFLNGDHHLQEFEVNVCGDRSLNGIFRDSGDTDDPYILDVRYVYL